MHLYKLVKCIDKDNLAIIYRLRVLFYTDIIKCVINGPRYKGNHLINKAILRRSANIYYNVFEIPKIHNMQVT